MVMLASLGAGHMGGLGRRTFLKHCYFLFQKPKTGTYGLKRIQSYLRSQWSADRKTLLKIKFNNTGKNSLRGEGRGDSLIGKELHL